MTWLVSAKRSLNSYLKEIILKANSFQGRRKPDVILRESSNHDAGVCHQENALPPLRKPFNDLVFSSYALQKLIGDYTFESVLDIGSGSGLHANILVDQGKKVTSIDFGNSVYFEKRENLDNVIIGNYYDYAFEDKFDAIWASHVLEHQPNPNLFLKKINNDLRDEGILAITVPPLKHEIVGGHLTLWNAGLLLYHLVIAGFNCKNASILKYGYNISLILKKDAISYYPDLAYDSGDIKKLLPYFPDGFDEPFDGDIYELNWF